jgi:flagellar hook-associated protein 2
MAISGLSASSIDVQSIVSQLMQVERRPVNQLSRKSSAYETQLSVIGTLKNTIADFQTAVRGLKDTGSFQSFNTTSSDTSTFTATAGANATTGSYALTISSLAQAQQLVAGGQVSSSATIGSGAATTLSFDFGRITGGTLDIASGAYSGASFTPNGSGIQTVTIDASNNTLEGIRDAVNSARIGVTASIINDGGATPYRLAFSASASGVENSMRIAVDGDAALSSLLSHDPTGTQHLAETLTAQNANFTLNGVAITKASNTVTDVVEGVTFNLTRVTTAPVNLTVTKDTAAINEAANTFITKYNTLMNDLKSLSAFARSGVAAGGLAGDPAVRQMINELTTIISGTVSGGAFATLTSVGISTRPGVGLTLDTTLFNSAIDNNLTDLSNLFTSEQGFATKLDAWASTSMNVTLTRRSSNINDAIKAITNEIDLREIRLASLEKRYTAQFTNLNVVLASMSSQQTFISQAFKQNNT